MISLVQQAADVQAYLFERQWPFCIIGGLAVIRWGEPRLTRDVDISLFTGFGSEDSFARALIARFTPRIPDALEFALVNRVLLLQGPTGIPIDVALAGFPFEEEVIERATDFEFLAGLSLRTVSAEDLIVLKAFADRERDWTDIQGIVARQSHLDWGGIRSRLQPLVALKEAPEIAERLERVHNQAGRP